MNVLQKHRANVEALQRYTAEICEVSQANYPKLKKIDGVVGADSFEVAPTQSHAVFDTSTGIRTGLVQHLADLQRDCAAARTQRQVASSRLAMYSLGICTFGAGAALSLAMAPNPLISLPLAVASLAGCFICIYYVAECVRHLHVAADAIKDAEAKLFAYTTSLSALHTADMFAVELNIRRKTTGKMLERSAALQRRAERVPHIKEADTIPHGELAAKSYGREIIPLSGLRRQVGIAWSQGLRPRMEDRYSVRQFSRGSIVSLFDGHGEGSRVTARFASRMVPDTLIERLEAQADLSEPEIVRMLLKDAFYPKNGDIEAMPHSIHKKIIPGNGHIGTTALIAVLLEEGTYIVNLGDCRALAIDGDFATRLTVDHTASNAREVVKLASRGIDIDRSGAIPRLDKLAVTRGLGDTQARLMRRPDVTYLPSHGTLFLGTDGVFDVLDDSVISRFVSRALDLDVAEAASGVVHAAYHRRSVDNMTAIIISAEEQPTPP